MPTGSTLAPFLSFPFRVLVDADGLADGLEEDLGGFVGGSSLLSTTSEKMANDWWSDPATAPTLSAVCLARL